MDKLLDFDSDFDVGLLDQVITIFYDPVHPDVRPLPLPPRTTAASFPADTGKCATSHRRLDTRGGLPVRPGVPLHRHVQVPPLPASRARGRFCCRCDALW